LNHAFDGVRIKRIGTQAIQAARGKRNHAAPLNNRRRFRYDFRFGLNGIYFNYLRVQGSTVLGSRVQKG
jgi:hypothetical protein